MTTRTAEPDLSQFLTTGEVADMYGVTQQDVQKAIKRKLLPAQKIGYFYVLWRPNLPEYFPTSDSSI